MRKILERGLGGLGGPKIHILCSEDCDGCDNKAPKSFQEILREIKDSTKEYEIRQLQEWLDALCNQVSDQGKIIKELEEERDNLLVSVSELMRQREAFNHEKTERDRENNDLREKIGVHLDVISELEKKIQLQNDASSEILDSETEMDIGA
ncbi:MAG: hypothetical protein ABIC36_01355 [bacterium]